MTEILLILTIIGLIGNHLFFTKMRKDFTELQEQQDQITKELGLKKVVNSMPRGNDK